MNKHYDKYLCRADSTRVRFSKTHVMPKGRTKLRLDPPSPPPVRVVKRDVDWQNGKNMFMLSLIVMLIILLFIK